MSRFFGYSICAGMALLSSSPVLAQQQQGPGYGPVHVEWWMARLVLLRPDHDDRLHRRGGRRDRAADARARWAFIVAVTVAAEVGDFRRFNTPRQLMAYLGLSHRSVPVAIR